MAKTWSESSPFEKVAGVSMLLLLTWGGCKACSYACSESAAERAEREAQEAQCRQDLGCWVKRHNGSADAYCAPHIERLAITDMRWEDAAFESKFSEGQWLNAGEGTITYRGDTAKIQNQFGAWTNVIYECDFNPTDKTVLDVRIVSEGRL